MNQIIECVPNFSEGRRKKIIDKIMYCFMGQNHVKLLNYSSDPDYNRCVATVIGEPSAVKSAVLAACGVAVNCIDMNYQHGEHPRIGAADVIPFIPIKNISMEETIHIAHQTGRALWEQYQVPSYFYEEAATAPHRKNLAAIRKGGYEGLSQKTILPDWQLDYGSSPHPTAGVSAISARNFLIAFNISLDTADMNIAQTIAQKIRASSGGLAGCKAIGVFQKEKQRVQVSINATDFQTTSVHKIFNTVCKESKKLNIAVTSSELIGLVPQQVLVDCFKDTLLLEDFDQHRILENFL